MTNYKNLFTIFALIIITLAYTFYASAIPSLPTEFYGRVRDYNNNASTGQSINAYDSTGVLCGTFSIARTGFYGTLTCAGDDPETEDDEGAVPGESITFRYRGSFLTQDGDASWQPGEFHWVNLTYPVVFCGDFFCDAEHENFISCVRDCPNPNGTPYINTSINWTTNQSDPSGEGTGSQGTGTGGGSVKSPSASDSTRSISQGKIYSNITTNDTAIGGSPCDENWSCSNWTQCSSFGLQNRTCVDLMECGTSDFKPEEVQKCTYTPTCSDGIKNGLEDEIDCGGLCPPCVGCFDGIQNCHHDDCEAALDCGGPCVPCASCFDNQKNCHDGVCEDGLDCGGPCERKCAQFQSPLPMFTCKKDINPFSNDTLVFFILLLLFICMNVFYSQKKIINVKNDKSLRRDAQRMLRIMSIRRRMLFFIIIAVTLAIIAYLYYYFFMMCEANYDFAWVIILSLILIPVAIHQGIRLIEYSEKKNQLKMKAVGETHRKQLQTLINMDQESIADLENDLVSLLKKLGRQADADELIILCAEDWEKKQASMPQIIERISAAGYENQQAQFIVQMLEDTYSHRDKLLKELKLAEKEIPAQREVDNAETKAAEDKGDVQASLPENNVTEDKK